MSGLFFRLGEATKVRPSEVPPCWKKVRYMTLVLAQAHADDLTSKKKDRGTKVQGYKCPHCPGFHVGHPTPPDMPGDL